MLRTAQLRRQVAQPFVCWKCRARSQHTSGVRAAGRHRSRIGSVEGKNSSNGGFKLRTSFSRGQATLTSEAQSDPVDAPPTETPPLQPSFRDRLRQWEAENAANFKPAPELAVGLEAHQAVNAMTRTQSGNMVTAPDEDEVEGHEGQPYAYTPDQLVDVGHARSFLLPGDMVELLAAGSRQQELAIFIRHVEKQAQYYTMSGRWVHRSQANPKFYVPGFVTQDEIEPLIPYLPDSAVPADDMEKLHGFIVSLPRNVGRPLIQKMSEFWAEADNVYHNTFQRLDNAHDILAHPDRYSYATLEQITDKLLLGVNKKIRKGKDGNFPTHVLYAVHRKLLSEDIGFTPQDLQVMRTGALYEINSKAEIVAVRTTMSFVRKYRNALLTKNYSSCGSFMEFVKRARRRIDYSRTFREFTPYGTLGPSSIKSKGEGGHYRAGQKGESWQAGDFEFLDFMESWATIQSFDRKSILTGIGSEILRAIGRYETVDLDRTTAFTFLKEIGVIPPWENRAAYILRLPYTGRRLGIEYGYTPHTGFIADRLADLRKDWGDLPVYCVDDFNAQEIDDGISLEPTDKPGEYWIHTHIADPAAHMDPKGAAAQYAEYVTETIYFPERRVPMLHEDKVAHDLSLAPNRPCLTFSSKVNMDGEVIDRAVTPGIIRNVVFLDPGVLQMVTTGVPQRKHILYGEDAAKINMDNLRGRPLVDGDSFSEAQRKELGILHKLAAARTAHYSNRGAVTVQPDRPSVRVFFDGAPWTKPKPRHSYWHYGDPKIVLAIPQGESAFSSTEINIVQTCMLLANETAAQWCAARNIPIPYRISPRQPGKDPSKFFSENIRPYRERKEPIPIEVLSEYFETMGRVQPSTIPGPHLGIGVDMIARTTSPLRRFADLVVMWQIEAALIEEARTGKSLVGISREDYLPFTKDRLDSMLPRISYREKFINQNSSRADRAWELQFLVHAWKFGTHKLPSPLTFQVRSTNTANETTGGVLVDFLIGGQMHWPKWLGPDEVQPDDIFEVEIQDINVTHFSMTFNPIRKIGGRNHNEATLDSVQLTEGSEPISEEATQGVVS